MKNILIATDFSENAKCAFDVAVIIAKQQNATLHIFHSFQLQTYYANVPMNMAGDIEGQLRAEAKNDMKKLVKNIPATLKYKTYVGEDIFKEELNSYVEKENIDLVVIGAGKGNALTHTLLGSSANDVIDKIRCLVLTIPCGYEFIKFVKMLYASDLDGDEFTVLIKFAEFAKSLDIDLTILHVKNITSGVEEKNIIKLLASVRLQTDYPKVHMIQKEYPDTLEGIKTFVTEFKPDLFAMAIHDRSFLDKTFHNSLTKKMAHISPVPFLTYHKEMAASKIKAVNV